MDSDDSASYVGHMTIHESPDSPDSSQHSRDEPTHQLGIIQEVNAAADLGQDLAQDNQDSSDSAYEADTITDSPSSTSSTLQLNVSSDSTEPNEVKENSSDEDDMHMPLDLPAAAAAAPPPPPPPGTPIGCRNYDETGFGFKVCALHSLKHLHTACSGCHCKCKAKDIKVELPAVNVYFYYLSDSEDDGQDSSPKDM